MPETAARANEQFTPEQISFSAGLTQRAESLMHRSRRWLALGTSALAIAGSAELSTDSAEATVAQASQTPGVSFQAPEYAKQGQMLSYEATAQGPTSSTRIDLVKKTKSFSFNSFNTDNQWLTYRNTQGVIAGAKRQSALLSGETAEAGFNLKVSKRLPIGKKACASFVTFMNESSSSSQAQKCTTVAKPYSHGIGYYTPYTHSPVNRSDSTFPKAINKYLNDPYRNVKWAGDYSTKYGYSTDMSSACPDLPSSQDPRIAWRLKTKKGKAVAKFDAGGSVKYCDLVGTYTEKAVVQKKCGDGKFENASTFVTHTDGLREILAWHYGMPSKYTRVKLTLSNLKSSCAGKEGVARIKLIEKFKGDSHQQFQREHGSRISTYIGSAKSSYYSTVKSF